MATAKFWNRSLVLPLLPLTPKLAVQSLLGLPAVEVGHQPHAEEYDPNHGGVRQRVYQRAVLLLALDRQGAPSGLHGIRPGGAGCLVEGIFFYGAVALGRRGFRGAAVSGHGRMLELVLAEGTPSALGCRPGSPLGLPPLLILVALSDLEDHLGQGLAVGVPFCLGLLRT